MESDRLRPCTREHSLPPAAGYTPVLRGRDKNDTNSDLKPSLETQGVHVVDLVPPEFETPEPLVSGSLAPPAAVCSGPFTAAVEPDANLAWDPTPAQPVSKSCFPVQSCTQPELSVTKQPSPQPELSDIKPTSPKTDLRVIVTEQASPEVVRLDLGSPQTSAEANLTVTRPTTPTGTFLTLCSSQAVLPLLCVPAPELAAPSQLQPTSGEKKVDLRLSKPTEKDLEAEAETYSTSSKCTQTGSDLASSASRSQNKQALTASNLNLALNPTPTQPDANLAWDPTSAQPDTNLALNPTPAQPDSSLTFSQTISDQAAADPTTFSKPSQKVHSPSSDSLAPLTLSHPF